MAVATSLAGSFVHGNADALQRSIVPDGVPSGISSLQEVGRLRVILLLRSRGSVPHQLIHSQRRCNILAVSLNLVLHACDRICKRAGLQLVQGIREVAVLEQLADPRLVAVYIGRALIRIKPICSINAHIVVPRGAAHELAASDLAILIIDGLQVQIIAAIQEVVLAGEAAQKIGFCEGLNIQILAVMLAEAVVAGCRVQCILELLHINRGSLHLRLRRALGAP